MNLTTLIQASELQVLMASGQPLVILDCGYDLGNSGADPGVSGDGGEGRCDNPTGTSMLCLSQFFRMPASGLE